MRTVLLLPVAVICFFSGSLVFGQNTIKKEIDIGMSDLETIRPLLENALSPVGKFVLLPGKGTVMVIDTPSGIVAAEQAVQGAALPQADVALDFQFVTGLPSRKSITVAQEVPFPTAYAPPQIIVGPNGRYTVIPATPTEFRRRNIGVTSETVSTVNPDGSITMDIHTERTEFEGFINYGSAILPAGGVGTIPVNGAVGDPTFFAPFIDAGVMNFPIISTTRISTSIVIRPRVHLGAVDLDVIPRLKIEPAEEDQSEREPELVDLKQFQTTISIPRNETGRVYGFEGAGDEFNNRFFGAETAKEGRSAIMVKASLKKPSPSAGTSPAGAEDPPAPALKPKP
ncbi:MAG: hypothetical protein P1U87_05555 [Verrucomicrobiales bacterium]|nr:hypothetical protein [Verrucomicrobiales bacterium]